MLKECLEISLNRRWNGGIIDLVLSIGLSLETCYFIVHSPASEYSE